MNIVIISTRISGNDGVSLECKNWKEILTRMGHKVTFLAGELDSVGVLMPELHFQWPYVMDLHDKVVYGKGNYRQVEDKVFDIAGTIEGKLRKFLNKGRKADMFVIANALSLPMHLPLAVALKRVIEELDIPTIARHHDFWWERKRYLRSQLFPFFERWFPPNLPNIRHTVINSASQKELFKRFKISSSVISDSFDFDNLELLKKDKYAAGFRREFGIKKDEIVFLQATRMVPRKRIELSIELVKKLKNEKVVLVIAGHSGDEGKDYEIKIRKMVQQYGIRCLFVGENVNSKRRIVAISNGEKPVRKKIYTLWDCYINSDFVTYPTRIEGFGNQFIEAVFFKKPIILTPYPVYKHDIEPLGFEVVKMTDSVSDGAVKKVRKLLKDKKKVERMTKKNFKLGKENFSYDSTQKKIQKIIDSF